MLENINNEWHKLSDTDKPLNSGHEYIIADETRDGSCRMLIAGWYDAGDIITLEADVPEVDENITEDQRLLNYIFGSKVDVTVPQSGFYRVTNDKELFDDTFDFPANAIEGVERIADCKNEGLYWRTLPIPPEGLKDPNKVKDEIRKEIYDKRRTFFDERDKAIQDFMNNDKEFNAVIRNYRQYLDKNEDMTDSGDDEIIEAAIIAIIARRFQNIIKEQVPYELLHNADLGNMDAFDNVSYIIKNSLCSVDASNILIKMSNGGLVKSLLIYVTLDLVRGRDVPTVKRAQQYRQLFNNYDDGKYEIVRHKIEKLKYILGSEEDYNELINMILEFMRT